MKIAVCVKHAIDESELKIDAAGKPVLQGAASKMSTFDKNAVEEALRLRTALGGEVTAITVGPPDARKTLKEALAMGADKGVHVLAPLDPMNPERTASMLAGSIRRVGPFDLILCSEGSSDTYSGMVPPMLAEFLGVAYVGYLHRIEASGTVLKGERSLEESVESVESPLPAVASVVSEINEPRYPTLIQIMQASKKPVVEVKGEDVSQGVSPATAADVSMSAQSTARKHIMLEGTPDEAAVKLLQALEKEGVL